MTKYPFESFRKNPYGIAGLSLLILLIIAGILAYKQLTKTTDVPVVVATPTPEVSISPVLASPSPTATISPSPSSSISPTATVSPSAQTQMMPNSASLVTSNFYKAYKEKNLSSLAGFFTSDSSKELQSLHSRLFTGLDLDGTPGGPTLFSTNSASESVDSYQIIDTKMAGSNWSIVVKEARLANNGTSSGFRSSTIVLIPDGTSWKIGSYSHSAGSGKYDAFLIQ